MTKEFLIKARNYCRSDKPCLYCPYQTECDENECTFDEMSDSQLDTLAEDIYSPFKMKVYVVIMYKYAERSDHSYLLGVYSNEQLSIKEGEQESNGRGNKYYPEVIEVELDTHAAFPVNNKHKTIVGLDYE